MKIKKFIFGLILAIATTSAAYAAVFKVDILQVIQSNPAIMYLASGANTVERQFTDWMNDRVDVFNYMTAAQIADVQAGKLTIDVTTAINNACAANAGKEIHFPAGSYLYSGGCALGTGEVVSGDGRNATLIYSSTAAPTYLFDASGYGSGLQHIGFKANVAQTGGSYVQLGSAETFITDFSMDGDFNGIYMSGNVSRIRHGRFQNGAANSTRIIATGGDNSQVIDDVLMGAQSPQIAYAGIHVYNDYALMITNTSVLQQGTALLIDPSSSAENVGSLYVDNCFFDYSSGPNINIHPTGTGSVVRSRFSNVWAGDGSGDGVVLNNAGTGVINGIHFISPHFMNNAGSGLTTSGTVTDVSILGGEIAQNAYGIYASSGLADFTIEGARIGPAGDMTGNTNYGMTLSSGVTNVTVANNNMLGNGTGAIQELTGAITKIISGNLGYNPIAPTAVVYGASPFTWTNNTGAPVSFVVSGGTVSEITLGSVNAGTTAGSYTIPEGGSITITATAAPTLTYIGL